MATSKDVSRVVRAVVVALSGGDALVKVSRAALPAATHEGSAFEMVITSVGLTPPETRIMVVETKRGHDPLTSVFDSEEDGVSQAENPGRLCD